MMRKSLFAMMAALLIGATPAAMAHGFGGGGGGGHVGGFGGGGAHIGSFGGHGMSPMAGAHVASPMMMSHGGPYGGTLAHYGRPLGTHAGYAAVNPSHGYPNPAGWHDGHGWHSWHDHHDHHHHVFPFFAAVGFGFGNYYDYGYDDTCWQYYGWQRVWTCGGYPYGW